MNLTNENNFDSNLSISTILEISKKVSELLDNKEYNNSKMLITREHIKYNLALLIKSLNSQLCKNLVKNFDSYKRRKSYHPSNNIYVNNSGKLNFDLYYT